MNIITDIIKFFINCIFTPIYNVFFYALYGFMLVCSFIYELLRYAVAGILFPFLIIHTNLFKGSKERKRKKEEARLLREQREEEIRLQREKRAEQERLAAQQRQAERARQILESAREERELLRQDENDDLYRKDDTNKKKTFGDKINDFLTKINNKISAIGRKISNSSLNRDLARNKANEKLLQQNSLVLDFTGKDAQKADERIVYKYTGKNAKGEYEEGFMEAFSKVEVHSFLLSESMDVFSIEPATRLEKLMNSNQLAANIKFKNKDLVFFLTQLSTYIKAGIPLVESLKILERQYKNKGYKKVLRSMIYNLSMGDSFSVAMNKQGDAFPRLLVNMVKTSEMTGELPETLDDQADYYTEVEKTRTAMKSALTYPIIVLVFAVAVMAFIMISVVPQFITIFQSMDAAELPGITIFIMNVSNFLKNHGIALIFVIIAICVMIYYLYKNVYLIRVLIQRTSMKLPIIGNLIIYNEVTIFTKTFASLLAHNVFITDSMEILSRVSNNEIFRTIIKETIVNLAKGEKISTAFKDNWAFPQAAYEMIVTGEKTGELPNMMSKVSDYYQELHRNQVSQIKSFIEPVLIVFLTVVVGVIVLAVVIPMFSMYNALEGLAG